MDDDAQRRDEAGFRVLLERNVSADGTPRWRLIAWNLIALHALTFLWIQRFLRRWKGGR